MAERTLTPLEELGCGRDALVVRRLQRAPDGTAEAGALSTLAVMACRRVALALCVLVAAGAPASAAAGPLRTALIDPDTFAGPQAPLAFRRAAAAGATSVRLVLSWSDVAPRAPAGDRSDPANPAYDWGAFDAQVQEAHSAGLAPIVCVTHAPEWARDRAAGGPGTTWPKPAELARFALAAARRYDAEGVRDWQAWNEPNARTYLNPQKRNGRLVAARHYLRMVNAFARAVHAADRRNVVVAGGLAPFGHDARDIQVTAPLRFMRSMLCVSEHGLASCGARASLDVWAHNPYTSGGPEHHAAAQDDVSIGDLPEMRRLLMAAERIGHVRSSRRVGFWVTEFGWDTKPADPMAVPLRLHARWVAEALYRMWQSGVSLVTWWRIRDDPLARTPYQSGLYFRGGQSLLRDRPKPSLTAFRFPFVAFAGPRGVDVWGRVPSGRTARVVVERRTATGWARAAALKTDRFGIFRRRLPVPPSGYLRARLAGEPGASIPFSLTRPPELKVSPFGCGGPIRCS
jgi:hypothetical protein